jgi:hypothetical protein
LPDPEQDYEIGLCDHSEGYVSSSALHDRADQAAKHEKAEEARITVGETLRGSHDLVSRANQELQGARVNEDGLLLNPDDPVLDIYVAKCNLRRSLLIMDALLKALEQRGYAVDEGPTVEILGERFHFEIWEVVDVEKVEPEDHDLTGPYVFGHSRFLQKKKPSGRLVLQIREAAAYWAYGCRKSWRDGKKQRIEDRLNNFVASLIELAVRREHHREEQKRKEEERREAERRHQEAARVRAEKLALMKAERERVDSLIQQAENWKTSELLRAFVGVAKRELGPAGGNITADSEFAEWIDWASKQADRLDPLRESPPSILDEKLEEIDQSGWHYPSSRYDA